MRHKCRARQTFGAEIPLDHREQSDDVHLLENNFLRVYAFTKRLKATEQKQKLIHVEHLLLDAVFIYRIKHMCFLLFSFFIFFGENSADQFPLTNVCLQIITLSSCTERQMASSSVRLNPVKRNGNTNMDFQPISRHKSLLGSG